jgi:transcriptional regulator of acetoin/glycerol metabolism
MAESKTKKHPSKGFTAEEKAAMRERVKELKASKSRADAEKDVLAKIAEMPKSDRAMAKRLHAIVKDGKVVCVFQSADEVRDVRLQRHGEPRSGRHVADLLRAEGADRRRREEDRCAREEGGELTTSRRRQRRACFHRARPGVPGSPRA